MDFNTTQIASTSREDCRKTCFPGSAGYNGVEPCYMCAPGTIAPTSSFWCPVIYEIPTPTWGDGVINETQLNVLPVDLCIVAPYVIDGTMNTTWCDNCSAGSFQANYGRTACLACTTDTYASYNGSTACHSCPLDSHIYQPSSGPPVPQVSALQCLSKCPPGTYNGINYEAQVACMPCVPGSFSGVGDAEKCFPCAVGSYTPQFAADQCTPCPTGTSTLSSGANNSALCLGAAGKNLSQSAGCPVLPLFSSSEILSDGSLVIDNEISENLTDPLVKLQRRVLGTADLEGQNLTVTLEQDTILDPRLLWFMEQATGMTRLVVRNSFCFSRIFAGGIQGLLYSEKVVRTLQCTGWSAVWGFSNSSAIGPEAQITVLFSEVKAYGALEPILHLSLLLLDYSPSGIWRPFRYSGLPLFDGISKDAWVHNLGFGTSGRPIGLLAIQASTTNFDFRSCNQCRYVPTVTVSPLGMTEGRFVFKQGIAFYVEGAYLRLRIDETYQMLGLESIIPQVRVANLIFVHSPADLLLCLSLLKSCLNRCFVQVYNWTTDIAVWGYLPTTDCQWPATQEMEWELKLSGGITFLQTSKLRSIGAGIKFHLQLT